ncbi:hypothetical protein F5B22DRAFT_654958 [Xylaria bambusicola]|uniref:uncharacterized protein n=1 Tax=Xylaria bambusicola TaxID=326684 RepID=UPI002008C17C|nr:uncharacterized protein F5B22DRAFT_654958 [Xylaria bambusicola]KAI0517303.1 hypothetical protein F5B22DRAFT_654958 [Xylaria bambusicola]
MPRVGTPDLRSDLRNNIAVAGIRLIEYVPGNSDRGGVLPVEEQAQNGAHPPSPPPLILPFFLNHLSGLIPIQSSILRRSREERRQPSSRSIHRVSSPSSSQPNQYPDWQSSAFEPSADLFQSFGGDCTSVAPLTNDWLYGYGLGDGSSSGGEGDGTFDGGLNLAIDWSLTDFGSSHETTPILGSELSPASLDDILPSGDSALLFPPLPITNMPSATAIPTTQPDHYSMSPPTPNYDQALQPTSGKRRSPPVDHVVALKRQRNNVAARKYRQKRIDRINELEAELDEVKQERDDLKLRLARQEAEAAALRSMLQMKSGESRDK